MASPAREIALAVEGDCLALPSREATSLALATSELVQNAVKHAFRGRDRGRITVRLDAGPVDSTVTVEDDGVGGGRSGSSRKGLGLEIVEALVKDDLKGRLEWDASAAGTRAVIRFPSPAAGAAAGGARP